MRVLIIEDEARLAETSLAVCAKAPPTRWMLRSTAKKARSWQSQTRTTW